MTDHNQKAYEFLNPYNFVSTPDRLGTLYTTQVGGDHEAPSRGRIAEGTISGWVDVELKATSPILLSDFYFDEKTQKLVRKVRTSSDKRTPELLATSFKGALRSAYEAITNSRFGTFDQAHKFLGTERQTTDAAQNLQPAYIDSKAGDASILLQVLDSVSIGANTPSAVVKVPLETASATLKRIGSSTGAPQSLFAVVKLSGKEFVFCDAFEEADDMEKLFSQLFEKHKEDNKNVDYPPTFPYFKAKGYLHWTGRNFGTGNKSKKNEHFFLTDFLPSPTGSRPKVIKRQFRLNKGSLPHKKWNSVIESYRLNADDPVAEQANTAWELQEGRTLWIKKQDQKIEGMYPSMIGRQAFDKSPEELVHISRHAPASKMDELSAADRVFGWVCTDSTEDTAANSLRGSVKIHPPVCTTEKAMLEFTEPFPLAILSGSHTSQWRFYTTNGYSEGSELRGRKFFLPHHPPSEFNDYWVTSGERGIPRQTPQAINRTGKSWYREYLSAGTPEEGDKVHTWIRSWVKPGTSFTIRIMLENVEFEDAAFLIWLLDLSNHTSSGGKLLPQIGIGFGKPLGFGSMTMKIKNSCLSPGSTWKQRYSSLSLAAAGTGTEKGGVTHHQLIQNCEDLVQKSAEFSSIQEQFLAVTTGWQDIPVHYPRESEVPVQEGYEWFTTNKKARKGAQKLPLLKKGEVPVLRAHAEK